ncbi:hypothetical protein CC2G_005033 [Coprinopsis cinerea AmutBmut pab1-1]|nr:hypothetical protein CC2G_005033 [Coprinopsis cinerea AmutBmut pab1-1]
MAVNGRSGPDHLEILEIDQTVQRVHKHLVHFIFELSDGPIPANAYFCPCCVPTSTFAISPFFSLLTGIDLS